MISSGPFQNAHPKIFSILCEMGGVADSGASSSSVLPQTHLMIQSSKFSFLTSVFISTYKDLTIIPTLKFHLFIFVDRNLFTPLLCDDTQLTTGVITAHLSSRLPLTIWPVLVIHLLFMETIGSQQPQHHLPMGLSRFQKEVLAATNAAQQKALTCPRNAKPTLGISKSGDSCSGGLFPKACGRHV